MSAPATWHPTLALRRFLLTRSSSVPLIGRGETAYFLFETNDWPWSFTYNGPWDEWDNAVFALSDLADEIDASTWNRSDTSTTVQAEDGETYVWQPSGVLALIDTISLTVTTSTVTTTVSTGMNPDIHPMFDQLPTPATEVFGTTVGSSTTLLSTVTALTGVDVGAFTTSLAPGSDQPPDGPPSTVTLTVGTVTGCSSLSTITLELVSTLSTPAFRYNSQGLIVDEGGQDATASAATTYNYRTTVRDSRGSPHAWHWRLLSDQFG